MTSIPPTISAEIAQTRQNFALSTIKQSADQGKALAEILDESARSAPVNETRGSNVDISV